MRHLIFDTETTGLSLINGDRVIEVAFVEYVDGQPTGSSFYSLINPERDIPQDAIEIHGITSERVKNAPLFKAVAREMLDYIKGAKVIAHNAHFDVGMLDNELALAGFEERIEDVVEEVIDSLRIARAIYPKEKSNKLDALLERLDIDASARAGGHEARIDCELLGKVFFKMTDGLDMSRVTLSNAPKRAKPAPVRRPDSLPAVQVSSGEMEAHEAALGRMEASGATPVAYRARMG